ncbi:PcfJ domain-containing protein [Paraliomyxa miuraensis]|uniref:PcfJ domain-containing protein n=1 Tax=Paraliomyxa miuraensis TaxID=376150 RepID=UPI00224D1339|nr:PcfJ domain-containing protein [Paraliomyxa miuraensis]MCX4243925.1 PcfJ domain-containing protein [Paraliomyxa miuraensis]
MSERIINRHRPLRPGQLRARYLRRHHRSRREDPWAQAHDLVDDARDFDCHEHEYDYERWWTGESFDRLMWELTARLDGSVLFNPLAALPALAPTTALPVGLVGEPEMPVEPRLAEHLQRLPTLDVDSLLIGADMAEDLRCLHEIAAQHLCPLAGFSEGGRWRGPRDSLVAILLFRPFWIRSPRSWRPSAHGTAAQKVGALVEHVFARFDFPRFLLGAWLVPREALEPRWLAWTITLAQGGSLRRLHRLAFRGRWGSGFGPLPKKLPAHLHEVPDPLSLVDGLMYAEVRRLGGTAEDVRRLGMDPSFRIDPTVLDPEQDDRRFWEDTVRWLVRHRERLDALKPEDQLRVLQWARHRHTERWREPFEWSGRSVRAALDEARNHRRRLLIGCRRLRWPPHGWEGTYSVGESTWTFEELTSSEALASESEAMSHCVRLYDHHGYRGTSAIFSVRRDGRRRVTVEVRPSSRTVVQVAGAYNRRPSAEELAVIERWREDVLSHST